MACSKQISPWMEVLFPAIYLRNASECPPLYTITSEKPVDLLLTRLPIDFSKPIKVDLPISCAGAFVYWVEYDGEIPDTRVKGREGYFNVDPILLVRPRVPILSSDLVINPKRDLESGYVNLPLDGISMLTLVSKWMGPVSGW